jgi:hypothetical protein
MRAGPFVAVSLALIFHPSKVVCQHCGDDKLSLMPSTFCQASELDGTEISNYLLT